MIFQRLNQGNKTMAGAGLPFYPTALTPQKTGLDDMFIPFLGTMSQCPAFQVRIPGAITSIMLRRYNVIVGANYFITHTDTIEVGDGSFIVSWDGTGFTVPSEGVYYVRINSGGTLYDSELINISDCAENVYSLKWKDTKNWVAGACYARGYENNVLFAGFMGRPTFNYEEEIIKDGYGRTIPVLQTTQDVYVISLVATYGMMLTLQRAAHHDTITIKTPYGSEYIPIQSFRLVDTGEKNSEYAVCEMRFVLNEPVESTTYNFDTYCHDCV
jgi:hypothetical protein